MILLDTTTKTLQISLASAPNANQLPFTASYADETLATGVLATLGESDGVTTGTTAATILSAPGSGNTRLLKQLNIPNIDTAPATVTIAVNNNGTIRNAVTVTLQVGDNLVYEDANGWSVMDKNGSQKKTDSITSFLGIGSIGLDQENGLNSLFTSSPSLRRLFEDISNKLDAMPDAISESILNVSKRSGLGVIKAPSDETSTRQILYAYAAVTAIGEVTLVTPPPDKSIVVHQFCGASSTFSTGPWVAQCFLHHGSAAVFLNSSNGGNIVNVGTVASSNAGQGVVFFNNLFPNFPVCSKGQPLNVDVTGDIAASTTVHFVVAYSLQ